MIPNGCDLDLFDPEHEELLRPDGAGENDLVAVFSGAHGIANGLDAVLDAAAVLKKKGRSDIRLLFIGDGRLKPGLIKRAAVEGLDNCLFLEPVPKLKLTAYLRGADVGLMVLDNLPAFYYGTSPNKFFDYIAIGLPVVNNYPGWLAELIEENRCGLVVEPEDPQAFAEALEKLADDRHLAAVMGRNARLLAERQFSRMDLGNRFVDYLEKVYQG
jgi:glycosyltransferase involved in cell wall biosynthesis